MPPLPLPKMIPFYALEDSPIWTCLRQPGLLIDHGELRTTLSLDFGLTALLRARQMVFGRGPRRQLRSRASGCARPRMTTSRRGNRVFSRRDSRA